MRVAKNALSSSVPIAPGADQSLTHSCLHPAKKHPHHPNSSFLWKIQNAGSPVDSRDPAPDPPPPKGRGSLTRRQQNCGGDVSSRDGARHRRRLPRARGQLEIWGQEESSLCCGSRDWCRHHRSLPFPGTDLNSGCSLVFKGHVSLPTKPTPTVVWE